MSKNSFVLLWLCSAVVVTAGRALNEAALGYDLTIQIQAAQNLLTGKALSIYSLAGEDDLAAPARLIILTYFPAGYSLYAAALIAMGFSVAAVLKVGGAAGTILGWWGWATLAYPFVSKGLERGRVWRWAASAIAISSPLLFTPPWLGTDIFLWAAVPWVLMWVIRASDEKASGRTWFDALAGAACGFCLLMRYAGLFLVPYVVFLIFCQSKALPKVLTGRWIAFVAGLLPAVTLQLYLNQFISRPEARPGGVTFERGSWVGVENLGEGFWSLTSANFPVVWWMPRQVMELLTQPGNQAPWLYLATFGVFALPSFFAIKLGFRGLITASHDVRIAAVGLFVAVPLFLWACGMFGEQYVGVRRYYLPLVPLAVLVAYAFAVVDREHKSKTQGLLQATSLGYLTGYLCMAAAGVALLVLPFELGSGKRERFMGTFQFNHWPSMRMTYEFSAAREYVLALLKDEPTVLVTNLEHWFYADPSVDCSRLRRLVDLRAGYVSGPARLVFAYEAKPPRARYFENLPDLRLLREFPEENVKILEARIPDGSRIALNRQKRP